MYDQSDGEQRNLGETIANLTRDVGTTRPKYFQKGMIVERPNEKEYIPPPEGAGPMCGVAAEPLEFEDAPDYEKLVPRRRAPVLRRREPRKRPNPRRQSR